MEQKTNEQPPQAASTEQRPASQPLPSTATPLAKRPEIAGTFERADEINQRLRGAARIGHLVSPISAVSAMPPGFGIAISEVFVDAAHETYYISGGGQRRPRIVGVAKSALQRIAAAAGVQWDIQQCCRVDDASNPYYCAWRAVGYVRDVDGSVRTIVGNKIMDLRDGSPQTTALYQRILGRMRRDEEEKTKEKRRPDGTLREDAYYSARNQIRDMRLYIEGHAETKAMLRAIRSMGIRHSYPEAELQRPFIVAKLCFTGRVEGDAELQRQIALRNVDAYLSGTNALYGPTPAAEPKRIAPPPLDSTTIDEEDLPPEHDEDVQPPAQAASEVEPQPLAAVGGPQGTSPPESPEPTEESR